MLLRWLRLLAVTPLRCAADIAAADLPLDATPLRFRRHVTLLPLSSY